MAKPSKKSSSNPKKKGKKYAHRYTEEQRQAFLTRAGQIGVTPARKEFGWPSKAAATQWIQKYGAQVKVSELHRYAAEIREFYTAREKLALCHKLLDRCFELLSYGEEVLDEDQMTKVYFDPQNGNEVRLTKPTDARSLASLASTVQKTIQTMELLEGRVTDRTETVFTDPTEMELREMINEARARNAKERAELDAAQEHSTEGG